MPSRRALAAPWLPLQHVSSSGSFQTCLQGQLFKMLIPGGKGCNKQRGLWSAALGWRGGGGGGCGRIGPACGTTFPSGSKAEMDAVLEKIVLINPVLKIKNIKKQKKKRRRPFLIMPIHKARRWHISYKCKCLKSRFEEKVVETQGMRLPFSPGWNRRVSETPYNAFVGSQTPFSLGMNSISHGGKQDGSSVDAASASPANPSPCHTVIGCLPDSIVT